MNLAKETRKYKGRRVYLAKATNIRRRKLKKRIVECKGGKYHFCGYSKYVGALDFYHVDPETKDFGLSMDQIYRSWKITEKELDKCIIVCANCHREIHGGLIKIKSDLSSNKR